MAEILDFQTREKTTEVNERAVEILEDMLEDARSGRIASFVASIVFSDGSTDHAFSPTEHGIAQVGSLAMLVQKYTLMMCAIGDADDEESE